MDDGFLIYNLIWLFILKKYITKTFPTEEIWKSTTFYTKSKIEEYHNSDGLIN